MTRSHKTYKDSKESKDLAKALHDQKEGQRSERGGHHNLLREAEEERLEEAEDANA